MKSFQLMLFKQKRESLFQKKDPVLKIDCIFEAG